MRKYIGWGIAALVVIGLIGGNGSDPGADEATTQLATGEPVAGESTSTPEPTPEPDPYAELTVSGKTVHADNATLRGKVKPRNANLIANGRHVAVRKGRFSIPVTLSNAPDSKRIRLKAKAPGHQTSTSTVYVRRELSAAEKAEIRAAKVAERAARRAEQAAARANARAVEAAQSYLDMSGFSKQGLFDQLSSDYGAGFTAEEAQYAVDHVEVDWYKEAVQAARSYLEVSPMSRDGLLDQLTSEYGAGFTYDEALHAVNKVY